MPESTANGNSSRDASSKTDVELLIDQVPQRLSPRWLQMGAAWALLLVFSAGAGVNARIAMALLGLLLTAIAALKRKLPSPRFHPAVIWLYIFTVLVLVTTLLAADPRQEMTALLSGYGIPLIAFFALLWLVRDRRGLQVVFWGLLSVGAVRGLFSLWQNFSSQDFWFSIPAMLPQLTLIMALPVLMRTRGRRALVGWLLYLLSVLSLFFQPPLYPWLLPTLGIGSFLLIRSGKKPLVLSTGVVVILLGFLLTFQPTMSQHSMSGAPGNRVVRESNTAYSNRAAWSAFVSHPFFGAGVSLPDREANTSQQTGSKESDDDRTFSGFLLLPASYGLAGTLTILALLFSLLKTAQKELPRWPKPCFERDLHLGGVAVLLALLITGFFQPIGLQNGDIFSIALFPAIMLAARETLVKADPTRHPRRRVVPPWCYLYEAWTALSAILAATVGFSYLRVFFSRGGRAAPKLTPDGRVHCPYASGSPRWLPVCLHLHSNHWEGMFSPEEVVDHYIRLGAAAVILTDHNRITTVDHPVSPLPAYEHGWGAHNHHLLALGAKRRLAEHFPFGGSFHTRCATIARQRRNSQYLILAHPPHRNAWSVEDVVQLDYDALEIFNKYKDDMSRWDDALSAGRLVWGAAGDDCHDLRSPHQSAKRYLLIDARDLEEGAAGEKRDGGFEGEAVKPDPGVNQENRTFLSPDRLLRVLRSGNYIAMRELSTRVTRKLPPDDAIRINKFQWDGSRLEVSLDAPVDLVEIIGEQGRIRQRLHSVDSVSIELGEGELYKRALFFRGNHTLALNPLVRLTRDLVSG